MPFIALKIQTISTSKYMDLFNYQSTAYIYVFVFMYFCINNYPKIKVWAHQKIGTLEIHIGI